MTTNEIVYYQITTWASRQRCSINVLYELLKCTAWHVFILGRLIILTSVIDMNFVFPDVSKYASIYDVNEDGPSSVLDHPVVLSIT